jgi:hypothetical protein
MTTLEIVRLDSPLATNNKQQAISSNGVNKISPLKISPVSNKLVINNRGSLSPNELRNNTLTNKKNNFFDYDDDDIVHEIPINIIKSPSYTSNNNTNNPPILLSIETMSPSKKKQLEETLNQHQNRQEITLNHSPISSSSSVVMATTTTTSSGKIENNKYNNNNNDSLNTSDDIDYALNTNNSSNLNLSTDIKTNTIIRFNKYGFVQPEQTNTHSDGSLNKEVSSINHANTPNKLNNENKSMSSLPSALHKNSSVSDIHSNNRNNITNLKDYLQNTDVEEFAEHLPIEVIRQRETKWIEMLNNFDEWMEKRFKKIKSRCRKGIPQSMRSRAWMHLTGAFLFKQEQPNYYSDCLANLNNIDVNRYIEDIKKDLHRQFPSHEIFMKKEGRQMLFNVLKAYAVHNKEVGYCQAQGPIAALLLMHMPEEDSFWMLIRISDYYLKGYFKPGLEKVQVDGQALYILFKKENPTAYKLMKTQSIDPILYMTEWFMCIFARTLPWCTVLRVWDMFFCEGVKVLYRVGLYLMKSAFGDKQKFQRCQQQGMYETLSMLKNLPVESLIENNLVKESSLIRFSEDDLKKAFDKSAKEFNKQTIENNRNRKEKAKK